MATDQKQLAHLQVRWIIRRDIPEILAIETASFEFPWEEEDFKRCLRQRNCIGMVAVHNDRIVGFMIYELNKNVIWVLNFAVAPEMRRRGVGTQMVCKLKDKLSTQRRTRILLEIKKEKKPMAKPFFEKELFTAINKDPEPLDPRPPVYLMEYKILETK